MKITIFASPRFQITLTRAQVETLMTCSRIHYDAVCKSAGKLHGFLYGWSMHFELDPSLKEVDVFATSRELDCCCKILEMPRQSERDAAREISTALFAAHREATQRLGQLSFPVCLDSPAG